MKIHAAARIRGHVIATLRDARTGRVKCIYGTENTFVMAGLVAVARRLAGIDGNAGLDKYGQVTYGEVGTGITAPTTGDIAIETPVASGRVAIADASNIGNVAYIRFFFNTSEGNGVLKEFGSFGEEADGTSNSGTMYNRAAINVTKTASDTLTIEVQFTVA